MKRDQTERLRCSDKLLECLGDTRLVGVLRSVGILSGEAIMPFSFCLPTEWGSILKGKNFLRMEKILCFMNRPHFGRA